MVPRFAVVQGVKDDGSPKLRPIDNFSWSGKGAATKKRSRQEVKAGSVNGHFTPGRTIKHDHLDDLLVAMRSHFAMFGKVGCARLWPLCLRVLLFFRESGTWHVEG
jgi:hypothetical protein